MIYLAPMQSLTDYYFRNAYSRHYTGIDMAVSPFISLIQGERGKPKMACDVMPSNNHTMPVIPQILGNNPVWFIEMAKFLHGWGYEKINWNLGCPVREIARKKRGSGLLPYPELVGELLEKIIPALPQKLSVKIRLGRNNTDEIFRLIPVLNDFPLEYVIVHPRLGIQMYEGKILHDAMLNCLPLFKHDIIYNGDIFSYNDFLTIKKLYPAIDKWMIGRGVFYNPLLPSLIKGAPLPSKEEAYKRFSIFIFDLYNELQQDGQIHSMVNKSKMLWQLFSKGFVNSKKVFEQISHATSMGEIIHLTKKITEEESMQLYAENHTQM